MPSDQDDVINLMGSVTTNVVSSTAFSTAMPTTIGQSNIAIQQINTITNPPATITTTGGTVWEESSSGQVRISLPSGKSEREVFIAIMESRLELLNELRDAILDAAYSSETLQLIEALIEIHKSEVENAKA